MEEICKNILEGVGESMTTVYILFGIMIADVLTGTLLAIKEGKVNSSVGKNGALVKLATIVALGFVYLADMMFKSNMVLFNGFLTVLAVYESISVVENLGNIGMKGAKYLSKYLEQVNPFKNKEE